MALMINKVSYVAQFFVEEFRVNLGCISCIQQVIECSF